MSPVRRRRRIVCFWTGIKCQRGGTARVVFKVNTHISRRVCLHNISRSLQPAIYDERDAILPAVDTSVYRVFGSTERSGDGIMTKAYRRLFSFPDHFDRMATWLVDGKAPGSRKWSSITIGLRFFTIEKPFYSLHSLAPPYLTRFFRPTPLAVVAGRT